MAYCPGRSPDTRFHYPDDTSHQPWTESQGAHDRHDQKTGDFFPRQRIRKHEREVAKHRIPMPLLERKSTNLTPTTLTLRHGTKSLVSVSSCKKKVVLLCHAINIYDGHFLVGVVLNALDVLSNPDRPRSICPELCNVHQVECLDNEIANDDKSRGSVAHDSWSTRLRR